MVFYVKSSKHKYVFTKKTSPAILQSQMENMYVLTKELARKSVDQDLYSVVSG
jgi:hypothetical protein